MKQHLFALAVLGSLASAASAQSSVTLFGFLDVNALWSLTAARARFGRHVTLALKPGADAKPLAEVVALWPARRQDTDQGELVQGLPLRLTIRRPTATAELDLGEAARFWPDDEALARLATLDEAGRATIVYAEAG